MKLLKLLWAFVSLSFATTAALAQADAIPAKTIRLVVPLGAGSAPDTIARKLAAHLATHLKKTVIVENKPGFSGFIGGQDVVRSPGDGSTLYVSVSSFIVITPQVYTKIPYDPMKDLKPLVQVGATPLVLAVASSSKYKTLADFVAAAKPVPDKLTFGSFGNGTASHLMGEAFNRAAGIQLMHVPYKTSATPDVIGGSLDSTITDLGSVKPFLGEGARLRVLGVTGKERSPASPDIPTFHEQGYPALDSMVGWLGVFGPASMPADVARQLSVAIEEAVKDPQVRVALEQLAYKPTGVSGAPFEGIVKDHHQRWGAVIAAMGGVRLD